MPQSDNPMLIAALDYARRGKPVFPCRPDKRPYTASGFLDATTEPEQVEAWWRQWPDALIGMPTGAVSGVIVIDLDVREEYDGGEAWSRLEAENGQLPDTVESLTPSGGRHLWYSHPGFPVKNSAGKLGRGVDVRGDGGYVIVPPSQAPGGKRYEWEGSNPRKPAALPAWGLKLLDQDIPPPRGVSYETNTAESGQRNVYLASVAGKLAHAGLGREQIRSMVLAENARACSPPLSEAEIDRTVMKSATKWVHNAGGAVEDAEGPAASMPMPVSQPAFLATDFPPENPILGPFRSQQLALVYAPTGAGKTMFALGMAAAMSLGADFLRWKSHGPQRVLYVDGEMSAWELQRRLGGVQAPNLYLASSMAMSTMHSTPPLNLASPEGQATLLEWVRALDIQVVYLDNLMCLSFVQGTSINSDESWRPVNQLCLNLRAMGILVVILDHANQSGHIHGTKTKAWHVNHAISITAMDDEEPDAFDAFAGRVSGGTKPRIRVVWEKERGTKEMAENGGTLTDEFVATLGDIGTSWDVEMGDAAMKRRAVEMKQNGMNIREISEELMVSKSKVGRWTKGIK